MTIGSFLAWLLTVAFCTVTVCAMAAAFTPVCLIAGSVLMGLFFSPVAFAPYLMDGDRD
jgi:hypothetical protein